ncbi:TPA: HIRAN domain-containing protein [Kluyvera georgiana]
MGNKITYTIDVAGIGYKNKNGEERRDIVKNYLSGNNLEAVSVSLTRHGGNKNDRNAIGVYISAPGIFGCDNEMIGFVDREQAADLSPMLKAGWEIKDVKITRVWLPTKSASATPHVTIKVESNWTREDLLLFKKSVSDKQKELRDKRRKKSKGDNIKPDGFIKRIYRFIFG